MGDKSLSERDSVTRNWKDDLLSDEIVCAQRHFSIMVRLLDKPAILLDDDGCILSFNRMFCEVVGLDLDALRGDRFEHQLPKADKNEFVRFLDGCKSNKHNSDSRLSCAFEFQTTIAFLSIAPLFDHGKLIGFLCQENVEQSRDSLRLQYLMEHLDQGVWDYDTRSDAFVVSDAWYRIRGRLPELDSSGIQQDWISDIHPDDQTALMTMFDKQKRGDSKSIRLQYRHRHTEGHWVWILCCAKVVATDKSGVPTRIVGTDTDITKVKKNADAMQQIVRKLELALDASGIGVWEFDPNNGTVHWDDRMLEIYGLTDGKNDRSGELWETYLHPEDLEGMITYSERCQKEELDFSHDYRVVRPSGEIRYIRSLASQVSVPNGSPKLVGVNFDITDDHQRTKELERARAQLQFDSRHDALTGLGNRRLLDETTSAFFENIKDRGSYAVLHLDLDFFKRINDTLGHAAGDAVLVSVAKILQDIVGDKGLVCRIGGDEFAVFFDTAPAPKSMQRLCRDILCAFEKPIPYRDHHCHIGVSIGCALGHGPTESHSDVFINADAALYAAKDAGRNCFRVHSTNCRWDDTKVERRASGGADSNR